MHVYILSARFSAEIPEVILRDGCVPMMGNQTAMSETTNGQEVPITLEPAIWYKVLVLDSLSIDCSKRAVFWNSSATALDGATLNVVDKNDRSKRLSESMYIGGECFGFASELEDVFDVVETLLDSYVSGHVTTRQFRAGIFRQLHCCVLPSITLSADDIANTVRAYAEQKKMVVRADSEILKRDQQMTVLLNAMQRQRANFIAEIACADELNYPPKFARVLLADIEQDVDASWKKLDELQRIVDIHKQAGSSTPELNASRVARDLQLVNYNQVLAARAILTDYVRQQLTTESEQESSVRCLRRRSREPSQISNPLHAIYVGMNERRKEGQRKLCELADRKVLVLSVKEAIRVTLDELRSGEDTCGIDIDRTGVHRSTDVLRSGGANIPREWLTLTEQISDLLDNGGPLAVTYHQFVSHVIATCTHALHQPTAMSKNSVSYGSVSNTSVSGASVDSSAVSCDAGDARLLCSLESGINSDEALGSCKSVPASLPSHWPDAKVSSRKFTNSWPFNKHKSSKPTIIVPISQPTRDANSVNDTRLAHSAPEVESLAMHPDWFESVSDDSDMVIIHSNREDLLKKTIEMLKEDIQEHFTTVCRKIQFELKRMRPIHYRKIWLCYESHFYEQTMPSLSKLYEAAYASTVTSLSDTLSTLTVTDVSLQHSILVHMLQDKAAVVRSAEPCPVLNGQLAESDVMVHMASSVTVVYDRQTWPLPHNLMHFNESIECGIDALSFASESDTCSSRSDYDDDDDQCDKTLQLKPEWSDKLSPAGGCITNVFRETSPLLQLQHLTACLRQLNQQVAALQSSLAAQNHGALPVGACSDDFLDMLVVLFCNLDCHQVALLYPHLNLLADLMAPFFESGPYSFSLVQFSIAFQFLQDKLVLKRGVVSNAVIET